jgi:hypothetical protein
MASSHYYDVIIIGAGLAGRLLALILSAGNLRVLTLISSSPSVPIELPLTPIMERIAAAVDPSAETLRPASGFQVITPDIRLDVHGARSLEEELLRELPNSGRQVLNRLRELADTGRRLEGIFLATGTVPSLGLIGRLAFARSLLMKGLAGKRLGRNFSSFLAGITDSSARQVLSTLFGGLSLADPHHLTIAEAALLWHAASRPQVVDGFALNAATSRRFQDSPIHSRPYSDMAALHGGGKLPWEVSLRDGTRLGARHFIIDQVTDPATWPAKLKSAPDRFCAVREFWHLLRIKPLPSPLLAQRVMLAGNPPLLLTFSPSPDRDPEVAVEQTDDKSQPLLEADQIRHRLEPLLPFANYRLERRRKQVAAFREETKPARFGPKRLAPRILFCGNYTADSTMLDIHFPLTTWLTSRAILKKAL